MLRISKWQRVTLKDFAQRVGSKTRLLIFVLQTAIFPAVVAVACYLRFDLTFPFAETARLVSAFFIWIMVKDIVFHLAKPDRGGWGLVPLIDLPASCRE